MPRVCLEAEAQPQVQPQVPMAPPDYRQGIVRMYEALNVPVVPVALNSGLFWGRHALLWPGRARARFLPAIPPGLPAREFASRLEAAIEAESTCLIAEAVVSGEGRPADAALRERLRQAETSRP